MLKNKLIFELFKHLCLGKSCKLSEKIIYKICKIIKYNNQLISPIYIIETAIFNLLIPIHYTSTRYKINLRGKFLRQAVNKALLSVIKYSKNLRNNQTIAYKLAVIFIQLYKKDHILYKYKILYLNKILNL